MSDLNTESKHTPELSRLAREKANAILFDLIGKPKWDKGCVEQHLIDFASLVRSVPVGEAVKAEGFWQSMDPWLSEFIRKGAALTATLYNEAPDKIDRSATGDWIQTATELFKKAHVGGAVPVGEVKPVAWQYRMRPTWGSGMAPWGPWEECTEAQAADYKRTPFLHDWAYESRALYTTPPAPIEGWRPIETAPKDHGSTTFDVWANGERYPDCWWGKATYEKGDSGIVYQSDYDCNGPVDSYVRNATHWMPLPAAPQPGDKALEEPAQVAPEHQAQVDQMAADAEARREKERGILLEAANHLEGDGHFMPAEDADWAAGWIRRQIGAGATP